jgi:uncharacterized metal-binding protein YceD (DUF177 family)
MSDVNLPLSRVIRRDEIPEDGLSLTFQADADTRAAMSSMLDIPAVDEFVAKLTIERWLRDGLVVRGQIEARVVQTCVVSLEPVVSIMDESFEEYFAPDPAAAAASGNAGPEVDDVEPLVDHRLDVGGLVLEHLVLGLDPYPRHPEAAFTAEHVSDADATSGPFAALAALRKERTGD